MANLSPSSPDRMGRRVNLTLPPEIDQVLTRLADAAGTGKASFVREWLIGMAPELLKMAEALEAVRAGQVDSLSMLSEGLRGAVLKGQQAELELSHFRAAPRLRK